MTETVWPWHVIERFGAEHDKDLIVLCAPCHKAEHRRMRAEARAAAEHAEWQELFARFGIEGDTA